MIRHKIYRELKLLQSIEAVSQIYQQKQNTPGWSRVTLMNRNNYSITEVESCQRGVLRSWIHTSTTSRHRDGSELELKEEKRGKQREMRLMKEVAERTKAKDKETFMAAIEIFEKEQSVYKRGHVNFILGAVDQMKDFNVHKDVEAYKALINIFPVGPYVPKNLIQSEFMYHPRQQNTAITVLSAMSRHGCIPDDAMGDMIIKRFGKTSFVMKRYQRMMYWMPKFRSMNPYPIPWMLPDSSSELAVLALKRMAVDKNNEVTVFHTSDLESALDDTYVASAISPEQQRLILKHDKTKPLFVEGGFLVWLRDQHLVYFILRADPRPEVVEYNKKPSRHDVDADSSLKSYIDPEYEDMVKKSALLVDPSIHEQPEGTILSMCITGTSSKNSLVSWINILQKTNPSLADMPIVFSLRTPESGLQPADHNFEEKTEFLSPGEDNSNST